MHAQTFGSSLRRDGTPVRRHDDGGGRRDTRKIGSRYTARSIRSGSTRSRLSETSSVLDHIEANFKSLNSMWWTSLFWVLPGFAGNRAEAHASTTEMLDKTILERLLAFPGLVPERSVVPRSITRRALQQIDELSPNSPGHICLADMKVAITNFHNAFSRYNNLDQKIGQMIHELCEQGHLVDGLGDLDRQEISWDQSSVCDAFVVILRPRERVYFTLDMANNSALSSKIVSITMFLTVIVSLTCWIVGTAEGIRVVTCEGHAVNTCEPNPPGWMSLLEWTCVWIFSLEFLVRLSTVGCVRRNLLNQRYIIGVITGSIEAQSEATISEWWRLVSFLLTPSAIADLLSVVPYWIRLMVPGSNILEVLRVLYLVRISRLVKLSRALNADLGQLNAVHEVLFNVLRSALPAIGLTLLLIVGANFVFGTLIWFVERDQWLPSSAERFTDLAAGPAYSKGAYVRTGSDGVSLEVTPFDSVPASFWWTIVTITSVGYGDVVPRSLAGKIIGSHAMLYGTVILGLPLFVIGINFGRQYDKLMKTTAKHQQETSKASKSSYERKDQEILAQHLVDEYTGFFHAISCHTIVDADVRSNWLAQVQAALTQGGPSYAMDHLTLRILVYLAEVEEMCSNMTLQQEVHQRRQMCQDIRVAWHRLVLACCHSSCVPLKVIILAFLQRGDVTSPKARAKPPSMCKKQHKGKRPGSLPAPQTRYAFFDPQADTTEGATEPPHRLERRASLPTTLRREDVAMAASDVNPDDNTLRARSGSWPAHGDVAATFFEVQERYYDREVV
eukprot:NODE_935_length_2690_cov_6.603590.p1 GENE.NODE_935_length_2690_cov_6.603590~~NODE_935_length_2690_cov_6.603590.p1  ORF type:complete len:787 (-),score=161.67 NODE_935_length_2690_cov_6.603590:186-2546(-)